MQTNSPSTGVFCKRCVYDLCGVAGAQCPECGNEFDATDPSTYDASPRASRLRLWIRRVAIVSVVGALLYLFVPRGWDSITLVLDDGTKTTGATAIGLRRPSWWGGYHMIWVSDVYQVVPGTTHAKSSPATQRAQMIHKSGKALDALSFDTKGVVLLGSSNSMTGMYAPGKVPRISINMNPLSGKSGVTVEFDNPRKAARELMSEQAKTGVQLSTSSYFLQPIAR